ncbi:MAG: hypothetical protein CMH54_09655 [Myxococcales bacterium]|nr:hypothetical protein [Myxococcales bacterium]
MRCTPTILFLTFFLISLGCSETSEKIPQILNQDVPVANDTGASPNDPDIVDPCADCLPPFTCTEAGECIDTSCIPACQDKNCGADGCGGSCGACPEGELCYSGECLCAPDCTDLECGDDGCGGSCGNCANDQFCGDNGICIDEDCTPKCAAKECGDDKCGGSCGSCPPGEECSFFGHCDPVSCQPNCDGKECGDDGCSGTCGQCPGAESCGSDGQCIPIGCQPDCAGKDCGSDGCGGDCGTCSSTASCSSNQVCVDSVGCADGQRDGLTDLNHWPTVAACKGTFGFMSLRAPRTNTACGNNLGNECAAPEDLCSAGWHICMRNGLSNDLRFRLTPAECNSLTEAYVAASNNCSNPNNQNPNGPGCDTTEPYGCYSTGWCSAPPVCGPHETSHCAHAIWPNQTFIFGKHTGTTNNKGCGHISTSVSYGSQGKLAGVLCCQD